MLLLIISWFGVGFLSYMLFVLLELRSNEYDETDAEDYMWNFWSTLGGMTLIGYIAPVIILVAFLHYAFTESHLGDKLTKNTYAVLYKIANVGKDSNE